MKVSIIAAASVCGRIGQGFKGSAVDRAFLEQMRKDTGASLIGAGTLRQGPVQMLGPGGKVLDGRIRAVITASGRIPIEDQPLFSRGPRPLIFTSRQAGQALEQALGQRAEVVSIGFIGPGRLDLRQVMGHLSERGVGSLLIEGGSALNYEALRQAVVHELLVTICPEIIGASTVSSLVEGPEPLGRPSIGLRPLACRVSLESGEIFLRYAVDYETPDQE
jgi:riboflavin biosynthesis pyrimidine reductase